MLQMYRIQLKKMRKLKYRTAFDFPISVKKIIIISLLIHLITSIFSQGYYRPDEHYQIIEFALLKTGVNHPSDLAWEYHYKMRPAIQPTIAYAVIKFFNIFSIKNPFFIAFFLRLLSAIINFLSMYLILLVFLKEIQYSNLKLWLIKLSLFLWPLIYIHVRFSSENLSGALLLIAMSVYLLQAQKEEHRTLLKFILIGIIIGISFLFRYQIGIIILSAFLWMFFIKKEKIFNLMWILFGIFLSIAIGLVIDRWFYGTWTFTPWNYFNANIIKHKAAQFGVAPWWYYLKVIILETFPPFSIFILLSLIIIIIFKPLHIITWLIVPFLFIHSITGHKELRFLFPLMNITPLLFILSIQEIMKNNKLQWIKKFITKYSWKWLIVLFWIMNDTMLFIIAVRPSTADFYIYYYLYNSPYNKIYTVNNYNPFSRKFREHAIAYNFYKKPNIIVIPIKNISDIKPILDKKKIILLAQEKNFSIEKEINNAKLHYHILFRNIPKWAQNFNFNNWVNRTTFVTIYKVYK